MKNDKTSRIVLVLEILLIVLLHMSKSTGSEAKDLVNSGNNPQTKTVMTTVQPLSLTK